MSETVEHEFERYASDREGVRACARCGLPRSEHRSAPAVGEGEPMCVLNPRCVLAAVHASDCLIPPAPTPEKPADEDEAAARELLLDVVGPLGVQNARLVERFARAFAAAREQGRRAGAESMREAIVKRLRYEELNTSATLAASLALPEPGK